MKRFTIVFGVAVVVAALTPLVGGAQERVKAFDRLTEPRISLPADPQGASPLRQLCPESNETCRKYWAYTGNFVQNHTIPTPVTESSSSSEPRGCHAGTTSGDVTTSWARRPDSLSRRSAGSPRGPTPPNGATFDQALLRAADELHTSRFVSAPTWNRLGERYTEAQLREVVLIVGNYTQLAMFQNTLGAQLPPDIEGLPESGNR